MRRLCRFTVVAALACACERPFVYAPATTSLAIVEGRPAAYARIPPDAPRGDVRIATFGIAGLRRADDTSDEGVIRAIHLRLVVSNDDDSTWLVDTREQRVTLPGDGESRPAFASTDKGVAPLVDVPPGDKREIDLFFPLPEHLEKASELPAFDVVWEVHAGERAVVARAPFERLTVVAARDPYYYRGWGRGWEPPFYYDPLFWRGGAFVGVRVDAPVWIGPPIIEHRGDVRRAPPAR
ncbi:MAG: hypothetical protein KF819_12065 [Labilithrix sp.]|nr:hypothetical protein [Labilithrix sp.]